MRVSWSSQGAMTKYNKLLLLPSRSVVSESVWPHRRQPTRLPRPRDSPGKNTGVGCHFPLQYNKLVAYKSHLFLIDQEADKFKIVMLTDTVSGESFLFHRWLSFHWVFTFGRGWGALWGFFIRFSWPSHLSKIPCPNIITLGVRISAHEFWRDTSIQTIGESVFVHRQMQW